MSKAENKKQKVRITGNLTQYEAKIAHSNRIAAGKDTMAEFVHMSVLRLTPQPLVMVPPVNVEAYKNTKSAISLLNQNTQFIHENPYMLDQRMMRQSITLLTTFSEEVFHLRRELHGDFDRTSVKNLALMHLSAKDLMALAQAQEHNEYIKGIR